MRWQALRAQGHQRAYRRGQRGQALVESAMFFLFLVLLVAGATDIATLLNDHLNVVYAARQGARTGAVMGNQGTSDCAIIGAVQAAMANEPNLTLNRITIYQAGADGRPVGPGAQNVYTGDTQCNATTGLPTRAPITNTYPPVNRNNTPFYEDSLGVQLDYTYAYQFPLLGIGTFSGNDAAVMPISPIAIPSPIPTPTPLATPTP